MEIVDAMNFEENTHSPLKKGANNSYWGNFGEAITTLWTGLMLTLKHLLNSYRRWYPIGVKDKNYFNNDGLFTVRFPHESIPVPDNGRYKLQNEIDDCIVCDKCANVCPVDCIEIEAIRSPSEFGKTSDGTPRKIYAARFDIDMAKCCYCGLCTTVCPTECLTMTDKFDFSEYDVKNHIFSFATMTRDEILEKKTEWGEFEKKQKETTTSPSTPSAGPKPVLKPKIKIPGLKEKEENKQNPINEPDQNKRPDPLNHPEQNSDENDDPAGS